MIDGILDVVSSSQKLIDDGRLKEYMLFFVHFHLRDKLIHYFDGLNIFNEGTLKSFIGSKLKSK